VGLRQQPAPAKILNASDILARHFYPRFTLLVILSKREGATATESASKDPEHISFAIPPQGVLTE